MSLLVALACASGVSRVEVKTESEELWVPQDTEIMRVREEVSRLYGEPPAWRAFILESKSPVDNMLTPAGVGAMFELEDAMRRIPGHGETCIRRGGGPCVHVSITALWCNRSHFDAEVTGSPDPQASLLRIFNTRETSCAYGGQDSERLVVAGELRYGGSEQGTTARENLRKTIVGARYLVAWHYFERSHGGAQRQSDQGFKKLMRAAQAARDDVIVRFAFQSAFDEEISKTITGDLPLVATSFVLVFLTAVLTQFFHRRKCVSFAGLAAWGMITVGLSVAMGYGLVIWFGVPFTSLAAAGPFIFLGIGVDDMVIMLDAFRLARRTLPGGGTAESRAAFATGRAGTAITITSMTNIIAFAMGSITVIPAVNWFCIYAGVAILCDFILQMSFFLAIVVLHERRDDVNGFAAEAYRLASRETVPVKSVLGDHPLKRQVKLGEEASEAEGEGANMTTAGEQQTVSVTDRFAKVYGDVLMWTPIRVFVLVIFVAYAAVSISLVPNIEYGLPRTSLAADDSFLVAFFNIFDKVFTAQVGINLEVHFNAFDHSSPDEQARVLAAWAMHLRSPYVEDLSSNSTEHDGLPSSRINWLTMTLKTGDKLNHTRPCRELGVSPELCVLAAKLFDGAEPKLLPAERFNATLNNALVAAPSLRATVRRQPDGTLVNSFLTTRAIPVADNYALQLKIFREIERLDREINGELFPEGGGSLKKGGTKHVFTFSQILIFWQQDSVLWEELLNNLTFAGVGVFIVCVLALAHPAALIATAGVGVVDVFLFGSLVLGKIRFNVISVINFVIAVGLAVDYSLHFCHGFLAEPGTDKVERVKRTLQTTGSSIMKAGGTTLMGTIPMAFTGSTIFRTFFALLFSLIVYGLAVGLVLIPVVMSFVPLPIAHHLQVHRRAEKVEADDDVEGIDRGDEGVVL